MAKNDFDIDFDFNEEYGFDPKAFLGTEEYDENIDLNAFSDEELGLTGQKKASAPAAEEEFDLEEDDVEVEDFLNMRRQKEAAYREEAQEEAWADEAEESEEESGFAADEESAEDTMDEEAEYEEDLEMEETEE